MTAVSDVHVPDECLLLLREKCPDSTEEERIRFLRAHLRDGHPQVEISAERLQAYLDWREAYVNPEMYKVKDDKAHWQAAWNLAITEALEGQETIEGKEKIRSEMNKLRIVIQYQDDRGCPVRAKDGSLLIHMMPAQINEQFGTYATYVEVLSRYADFKFDRHSLEQATVLLDVRPGKGWGNPPALTLLPLIRHTTHELSKLFPERLHKVLLFPVPRLAIAIWNIAKTFIHQDLADSMVLIAGSDGLYSPPPNKELSKYVDETVLDEAEQVRLAAFLIDENEAPSTLVPCNTSGSFSYFAQGNGQGRQRTQSSSLYTQPLLPEGPALNGDYEYDDHTSYHEEQDIRHIMFRFLGSPYANNSSFWARIIPIAEQIGVLAGLASLALFALLRLTHTIWFHTIEFAPANQDPFSVHGKWIWLAFTTAGGFTTGILSLLPGSPRIGTVRSMFHDATDLKGHVKESPFVFVLSVTALITGAPLGSEVALAALGNGLAALATYCGSKHPRHEPAWVLSGVAAALGCLLPSPLFGVTLMHELSVAGRPSGTHLDYVVSQQHEHQQNENLQGDNDGDDDDGTVAERRPRDHDYMEQVTYMGRAAMMAYLIMHLLVPHSTLHDTSLSGDSKLWQLGAAQPLGLLCGLVGTTMMACVGVFWSIRVRTCRWLEQHFGMPAWVGQVFFPTLAGTLHGLLAVYNPFLVDSGASLVPEFVNQMLEQQEDHNGRLHTWFACTALCKVVSMSLCVGFGLVGGTMLPMAFVGLCVGLSLSPWLLPISFAVPSCICATVGSFVPAPFTLVLAATLFFSLRPSQMGPVFMATFMAYTFTGGLGIVRRVGEAWLRRSNDREEEPLASSDDDNRRCRNKHPPQSDNSIVRGVQSTIFGEMI